MVSKRGVDAVCKTEGLSLVDFPADPESFFEKCGIINSHMLVATETFTKYNFRSMFSWGENQKVFTF